jgi:hypothetical protein
LVYVEAALRGERRVLALSGELNRWLTAHAAFSAGWGGKLCGWAAGIRASK